MARKIGSDEAASRFNRLIQERYAADLQQVEEAIRSNFVSDVAIIPIVSDYLISSGGKRIRPTLTIIGAKLNGYEDPEGASIKMSVALEYIHAATLLHDDVVDESDLRRGAESANARYGNGICVLVGDFLFAKAFELMTSIGSIEIVESISTATKHLAEGELIELVNERNVDFDEDDYLAMVFGKTAALIVAAIEVGALLSSLERSKIAILKEAAKNIGIAFQLIDDALDFLADKTQWGKPIGADLIEGRVTLPLIRMLRSGSGKERDLIKTIIETEKPRPELIEEALGMIGASAALESVFISARSYVERAKEALEPIGSDDHVDALVALADYVIARRT